MATRAAAPVRPRPADELADEAVALVARWLVEARESETRDERALAAQLVGLLEDPDGLGFTMRFVDRVARPERDRTQAHQLAELVDDAALPRFLGRVDRLLLRAGALVAPRLPRVVMPLARRRLRQLVGHLVVDAEPDPLGAHLAERRAAGYALNVNLLGEAVLGEDEARRRLDQTLALVRRPDVDYVSVKVSAVASQLELWAFDATLDRVAERLRVLYAEAAAQSPPVFVNLDMEGYDDLDLTVAALRRVLDEPAFAGLDAGVALQAYLPDCAPVLEELVAWAAERHARAGGTLKVRLVKGANLAMERVSAETHGWPQAPYPTKADVDASYKRCLDLALRPERLRGVRVGLASHNLFDVAWGSLLARERGVADRVDVEMLQGMAPSLAREVRDEVGGVLLYTPVVAPDDLDVAVSYLFRRLEENSSDENFLSVVFTLQPGTAAFAEQEARFREALAERWAVPVGPRRTQDRRLTTTTGPVSAEAETPPVAPDAPPLGTPFANEPDSDRALSGNRAWAAAALRDADVRVRTSPLVTVADADAAVARARDAGKAWGARPAAERRAVLHAAAARLAARRGDLLGVMAAEAGKTVAQSDPEVSEVVDFARWYADRCGELDDVDGAVAVPLGVVLVTPPWNFPVAIPGGGCLAALAAGNAVLFKPAPQSVRCAEVVAECLWEAGVPRDVLQLVPCPEDETGRRLVTHPDVGGVVLTGAWATAQLFRSWRPDLHLVAETSGKNALVVTPSADLDLAVGDLVGSAFGHAGQKCSAASLGILVGDLADSPRFRRQLADMVRSLEVGPATDLTTVVGPLIAPPSQDLLRALTTLDEGERWLVEPRRLDDEGRLWTPGVKEGVRPGSWFHTTECFGPVLGLMRARDLDEAVALQNGTPYGLTGGISSLDPHEVDRWLDRVEVGNAYVNRVTTGAVVRRQPFGGWKRSSVGAGWKAGGPNTLLQLVRWEPAGEPEQRQAVTGRAAEVLAAVGAAGGAAGGRSDGDVAWLRAAAENDAVWWAREYGVPHDPTGLVGEANAFRYRARPGVALRLAGVDAGAGAGSERDAVRALLAAVRCGVVPAVSLAERPREDGLLAAALAALPEAAVSVEDDAAFRGRLGDLAGGRVRLLGPLDDALLAAAHDVEVHLASAPVTASGRLELLWYLREQAVSRTLHRFGNLTGAPGRFDGLAP